jgi:RHS repeat-associated protein
MRTVGQAAVFFVTDHLGSTNKLVDPYGAPLPGERQLYKPWGEKRLSTSISLTRVGYTGQYEDGYITLYWMNARWYDPALSRWIQPDIIVPLASQGTQAWDRFAYSNNNPIRFKDPSGHDVGCHGEDLSECISQPSPAYWKAAPTSTPAPTNTPPPPSFYSAAPTPEPTQMPYYTEACSGPQKLDTSHSMD